VSTDRDVCSFSATKLRKLRRKKSILTCFDSHMKSAWSCSAWYKLLF